MNKIFKTWDNFFFQPQPTESMAAFRILWGLLVGFYLLLDYSNIHDFYGPHGLISLSTVKQQMSFPHMNLFLLFNPSYEMVDMLFGVYGLAILGTIFGFYTRSSLVIMLICMISLQQRNIWILSSSEQLMSLVTLTLACSPCGHSLSIDSLLGRKFISFRNERNWAPWALRMLQIQISLIYILTVGQKLQDESWLNGSAVYYLTRIHDTVSVPFLLDNVFFLKLATWGTLLTEMALGTLIWFKRFRLPVIAVGILFHLVSAILLPSSSLNFILIGLMLVFVSPLSMRSLIQSLSRKTRALLEKASVEPGLKNKIIWIMGDDYAQN